MAFSVGVYTILSLNFIARNKATSSCKSYSDSRGEDRVTTLRFVRPLCGAITAQN